MLLEEFDIDRKAVLNPEDMSKPVDDFPRVAVSCFSYVTLNRLIEELCGIQIASVKLSNVDLPIYKARYKGVDIALFMSHVGAAGCVALLEEIFVMGVEKLVIFGTCGVLDKNIEDCSVIIPEAALRDEGTSFHYVPPADEIEVNLKYSEDFKAILKEQGFTYTVGKVWTTDACYRETREKIKRRKARGCVCVDMECSAVAALAEFRGKDVLHFFYAADNLDNEKWDARSLSNEARILEKDRIALIAMEMAAKMGQSTGNRSENGKGGRFKEHIDSFTTMLDWWM